MKLVFYGGGDEGENKALDEALMSLASSKKPRITYIPSCSYDNDFDFRDFVNQYKKFNITKFLYLPIDRYVDSVLLQEAFKSDIIHLSGGNTFYFLKYLRKTKMMNELKKFVKNGGILTGLSAGAILMTPSIDTAAIPSFDSDENAENIKSLNSMGLVNFEFFPHYINSERYDKELLKHSKKLNYPLYACPDGSGIIVNKESICFVGKSYCFYKGKKVVIKK